MTKKRKKRKPRYIRIISLIILALLIWWFIAISPGSGNNDIFVGIEKGESISSIGHKLKENNLIKSEFAFKLAVRQKHADTKIKYGTHKFSSSMGVYAIVNELTKSSYQKSIKIVIPEGWTVAQIQNRLRNYTNQCPDIAKKFDDKALNVKIVPYNHLYGDSLEGYLFPDTYTVSNTTTSDEFIEKMLWNFDKRIQAKYMTDIVYCGQKYFNTSDYNEALYKVLTVASLIEREVKVEGERELTASVIYNRLSKKMPLQIDATVSYVPGKSTDNKDRVLYKDLKKKTPYNTYVVKGLPKGPICNPGEKCFYAACHPKETDYLYYVAKADGSHIFAKTLEEHNENIKKVRE
ncbi:MAG: endolytic transglycosylase MltG [Abditibacteriota bacterium]|nr:endolytic transglycosylase MltG [Abditibacteriota bacterium]